MNKLLSAVSGLGMLFAVGAAQAADMLGDKELDIVTAGNVVAALPTSSNWAGAASNLLATATSSGVSPFTATATAIPGAAISGHCAGNCTITATP